MPAYNSSATIFKTIESVLNQTYQEWELIIIDDSSIDDTTAVISAFSDARIKVVRLPSNAGPGYCRDLGLKKACGTYIAFLDADDIWLRDFLNVYVKALQKHDADLVYGSYIMKNDLQSKVFRPEDLCFEQLFIQSPLSCLAVLLTRSAADGCAFTGRPREDLFFWSQALQNPLLRHHKVNEPLAVYCLRKSSRSSQKFAVAILQFRMIWEREEFSVLQKFRIFIKYLYFGLRKYRF